MWLNQLIARIDPLDQNALQAARARQDSLTKPPGSLGRLEALAVQIAGVTGRSLPRLTHKVIVTIAADHGVVAEGVSAYPQAVTAQMVQKFLARRGGNQCAGAASRGENRLCRRGRGCRSASLGWFDCQEGLSRNRQYGARSGNGQRTSPGGASNRRRSRRSRMGPRTRCAGARRNGHRQHHRRGSHRGGAHRKRAGRDRRPRDRTGRRRLGPQASGGRARALAINRPDPSQPLDVLAKVGGLEIAALAGAALAAAAHRRPVVVDGYPATAAAMIAAAFAPAIRPYLIAAHRSQERGHQAMLDWLGLEPLLDLGLRLGEGTGAALALSLLDAACRTLCEMATFVEAGVSTREAP